MKFRSFCSPKATVCRVAFTLALLLTLAVLSQVLHVQERREVIRRGLDMAVLSFRGWWAKGSNSKQRHDTSDETYTGKNTIPPGRGSWFHPPNCTVLEMMAAPDGSVREAYNSSALCGPRVADRDVFCVLFFLQNGLTDDGDCVRLDDDSRVPRIVYFVIFGTYTFQFWHYVSIMAAKRYMAPAPIYVIGEAHPLGYWWQRVLKDCTGVRFVYRPCPGLINGQKVIFPHHWSDIVRLQALLLNGGLYLDLDMVLTRDPDPLFAHDVTMGLIQNVTGLGNAFIAAKRNSDFVREWYGSYNRFSNSLKTYFYNSLRVPFEMWRENSSRVHVESSRLYGPNWFEADKLFKGWDYDWRQNYAVHVWTNGNPVPRSEEEVQTSNTTIAQVFRNALYGDPAPRWPKV